jgi:outer membrane protein OmpA-like peptidoglycan-associated protein
MSASPWGESSYEGFAAESPQSEGSYGESGYGETYESSGESEWDSPFAAAEAEIGMEAPQQFGGYEYGQQLAHEYGQGYEQGYGHETYAYGRDSSISESGASEWESPFTNAEEEIMPPPNAFPSTCGDDVTYASKVWKHGEKNKSSRPGKVSNLTFVPRSEVYEFAISDFDVDRYELKQQHKDAIADFTKRVQAGIREQRYSGEPIRVYTYGEASSTASHVHNLELSHHRAFNTLHAIRCAFQKAGISPAHFGFYGTGEVHARTQGPDKTENAEFRGVIVRAFAPLKACKDCKQPPGPKPPAAGATTLCVSVPKIQPRNAAKLPPDVIPLGSIVPGLRLPVAIVTKAQATIRVDERRSRQSGIYNFQGWGLEFALPPGKTRIDLQADLRASLEVLVRASASLSAKLRLGPLKLVLKIDASAFAQLVAKLCAQIRLRIDVDLGRPNIPELRECRLNGAQGVRGAFPFAALSGPTVLLVPGAGYGPAVIHFAGGGVAGLGLGSNPMLVPADKSTVKSLLALGGTLKLQNGGVRREAEYELPEAEWPEAFAELQPELAPFV